MAGSPYNFYLDILSRWPSTIALASQWFVYFDLGTVNALQADLASAVRNYDAGGSSGSWEISQTTINQLLRPDFQIATENLVGCVFARQVQTPTENIVAANQGLSYGGYQAPATVSSRSPYQKLTVVFTETNASFIDLVLRPWSIMVGYNGLVARTANSPKNIKCRFADIISLGKTGAGSPMAIRKVFRFYNLAPISVQGITNSYASEGLMYTSVDFVYDRYSILDAQSPQLMSF
jgi:hypothetical protein